MPRCSAALWQAAEQANLADCSPTCLCRTSGSHLPTSRLQKEIQMKSRNNKTILYRDLTGHFVAAAFVVAIAVHPMVIQAQTAKSSDPMPMTPGPMDASKMTGMKDMGAMKHMDGMSMTGDKDYDFAANMRMHHQMAVEMSDAEVKNGKDPRMIRMAKEISSAQKKEIAAFDRWMAAHKNSMGQTMPMKK